MPQKYIRAEAPKHRQQSTTEITDCGPAYYDAPQRPDLASDVTVPEILDTISALLGEALGELALAEEV